MINEKKKNGLDFLEKTECYWLKDCNPDYVGEHQGKSLFNFDVKKLKRDMKKSGLHFIHKKGSTWLMVVDHIKCEEVHYVENQLSRDVHFEPKWLESIQSWGEDITFQFRHKNPDIHSVNIKDTGLLVGGV